jgi:hypothetical protein
MSPKALIIVLPDSFEGLLTIRRLVKKLARYLGSSFLQYKRANHERYHDVFLFTHETRRENTERPDVSYVVFDTSKRIVMKGSKEILTPSWNREKYKMRGLRRWHTVESVLIHF